jgi:hypothetical protein
MESPFIIESTNRNSSETVYGTGGPPSVVAIVSCVRALLFSCEVSERMTITVKNVWVWDNNLFRRSHVAVILKFFGSFHVSLILSSVTCVGVDDPISHALRGVRSLNPNKIHPDPIRFSESQRTC